MRPLRPCLTCSRLTRAAQGRCAPCEAERQHRRNQIRTQYQGAWRSTSKKARTQAIAEGTGCALCGTLEDLCLDHEHGQVECRSCNSSHRRNV